MMPGAPEPLRRVRWYHLPIPLAASVVLSLVTAFAWLLWQAMTQPYLALEAVMRDFYFLSTVQAGFALGLFATSLWLLARVNDPRLPVRFARLARRDLGKALGWAIALILLSGVFELSCDFFLGTHLMEDTARLPIAPRTWTQLPLGLLVIAVLAPLSEEIFFRGLLLGWLHRHWGRWPAILVSSLAFGLVHAKLLDPGGLDGWLLTLELSGMGAVFALLALRTGNLWTSIAVHAANNFCAVLAVFLLLAPTAP